jgi:pimeloyl-ACP methyl ester carboxylesterase
MSELAESHRAMGEHHCQVLSADGVSLSYRVLGDGDAPVLVLLHSLGTDGRMWEDCVADLVADHRLIVPDSRGHGASAPAHAQSAQLWADDIDRIVRDAGATVVALAGVSMGGIQAIAYAAAHPDQVRAVIAAATCSAPAG